MITQELIDYVKTQLSSGVTREKITSDLLGQGGWTMEQINEAFGYAEQSIPTQMSYQATVSDMTQAPVTIKYFEWLMYASFLASIGVWIFQFSSTGFLVYKITAVAVPIIGILLKFFCVYKVAYHRAEWARIVLFVLSALNAFSIFGLLFYAFSNPLFLVTALPIIFLVTALPIILEIAAIYFVFNASSNAWLATNTSTQGAGAYVANNTKWNKVIPRINKLSSIVAVGIFLVAFFSFGGFSVFSDLDIGFFAMIMIAVIYVLGGINYFENSVLVKKYSNSTSTLDTWFVTLTTLRNIVFILNVIPLIQILGIIALVFGGIPYLIVYYFMIRSRNKSVVAV
jgi:hypothetical protein